MFTRAQYMASECTHSEYYGQYVTPEIKQRVSRTFGKNQLVTAYSTDKWFNNISLRKWDTLALQTYLAPPVEDEFWTLATRVCVLKEAARQIVEEAQNDHN